MHRGSPSFSLAEPPYCLAVPREEWAERVTLTGETCIIRPAAQEPGGQIIHCLRAVLEIAIEGVREPFTLGVWVSQSPENFVRYLGMSDDERAGEGSFGWLTVNWRPYNRSNAGGDLESLASNVLWRSGGLRPLVQLQACDHPLYLDQRDGFTWERAVEVARVMMHG